MSNTIFVKLKDLMMDKVFRIYKNYVPEHIKVCDLEKNDIVTLSEQLLNISYTLPKLFKERVHTVDKIYDKHKPNEVIYELFAEDHKVILLLTKNVKNGSVTIKWVDKLWLYSI
mgnify:CR=1 FL=1